MPSTLPGTPDPDARPHRGRPTLRRVSRWTAVVAGLMVLVLVGYAGWLYYSLTNGIKRSEALNGAHLGRSAHGDVNILLMGLDSRLDENGRALPRAIYSALHAGDQSSGGENANVLILLHLPGHGAPATAISIPRDDYVAFPGCPDGQCHGKVKQAYGLAFDAKARELAHTVGAPRGTAREQVLRDAGRTAEVATVSQFLGGVPIDHFVEVTMVAFYQLAQVVQPITVCVAENTTDTYSGARFHQGLQQLDAMQAVAFVRQRRDTSNPGLNFTDLDRSRRQQAFITSLATQLRQTSTFVDPTKLTRLVGIAKKNIAVDAKLDLLGFAGDAQRLAGGRITFYTLPVQRFGRDPLGEDVNFVDLPRLQATVKQLLSGKAAPAAAPTVTAAKAPVVTTPPAVVRSGVVSVVNGSHTAHLAATVRTRLQGLGYRTGSVGSAPVQSSSVVTYGPGGQALAGSVASALGGLPLQADGALPAGTARVVLGADFKGPGATAPAVSTLVPVNASVASPAHGFPSVTQLTALAGGGVRCVK